MPTSPMKAAKDALKLAVASLPTSLQPLINRLGQKIIMACCKQYAKESIAQQMEKDQNYVPHSAKANDFTITLSQGLKENNERVCFLEEQVQQEKEVPLKQQLKNASNWKSKLQKKKNGNYYGSPMYNWSCHSNSPGHDCDKHLQTINALVT